MKLAFFISILFISELTFGQEHSKITQDAPEGRINHFSTLQMHYYFYGKHQLSLQYFDSLSMLTNIPTSEALNTAFLSCDALINSGEKTSYPDLQNKLEHLTREIAQRKEVEHLKEKEGAKSVSGNSKAYGKVDIPPSFRGGMSGFYRYVADNLEYPVTARIQGIEGRVYVQFVVTKDGKVTNVKAVKGIGAGCDEESERVVSQSTGWTPGYLNQEPVDVRIVLPIIYKLSEEKSRKRIR